MSMKSIKNFLNSEKIDVSLFIILELKQLQIYFSPKSRKFYEKVISNF